jgi:hypothetical protein
MPEADLNDHQTSDSVCLYHALIMNPKPTNFETKIPI